MITTDTTINNYIEALTERANQVSIEYAMGCLYSTLKSLKLQSYELEVLQQDTKNLKQLCNNVDLSTINL